MMAVPREPETIFYDGHCGLCHRTVTWVLREDADGSRFRFAPLQGEYIKTVLSDEQRKGLPDSIVVLTHDGRLLLRSAAVAHILERLGHTTRATLLRLLTRPVADLGYRFVAAVRHLIFAKPADACPMMPPELRPRFRM